MLSQTDTATIWAEPALVKPPLIRKLCADYDWALRELGRQNWRMRKLESQLAAYQAWLRAFVEVCPPPEDGDSVRELVEKLKRASK